MCDRPFIIDCQLSEIKSQEMSLQWHLDTDINVWSKLSTGKIRGQKKCKNAKVLLLLLFDVFLLAFVCVWVEGMLMRVLGMPPLAGDTRCCFVDFTTVVLAAAAETVGGEAGALTFLHLHLSWTNRAGWRVSFNGHLCAAQSSKGCRYLVILVLLLS